MKVKNLAAKSLCAGAVILACLSVSQPAAARHPCTEWPMTATVTIHSPGTPFGPQLVDICKGGQVTFVNQSSGQPWTIKHVSGPAFANLPVPNNSSNTTAPLTNAGTIWYKIGGPPGPPFVLHGQIVVHP